MAKFTISLDKIIDEFKLETIYTPKNASEIEIDEADVTRPGLQLMGFYEYFNPERIQIIGKMEYAYLSTIDEETRVQRLDMLFSQRIPALVISRELPYFEEMLDLAKKYSVPLLRSKESTSNFIAGRPASDRKFSSFPIQPSERAMIWISLGPMRIPMVSPGVQARVEWISHSRPSNSTCISK